MGKLQLALVWCEALAEHHPWLLLAAVGALNELLSRSPRLRAMTIFQVLPNLLKATVLRKAPGLGWALEKMDTPEPSAPEAPKA